MIILLTYTKTNSTEIRVQDRPKYTDNFNNKYD